MPCAISRYAALPVALALLGLTQAALAQKPPPAAQKPAIPAKDGFFAKDAVINYAVNDAAVGFARADDVDSKKNPTSPTVRFDKGGSVGGTMLVLNNSRVTINGGSIGKELVVYGGSTLTISSGSIGDSVLGNDSSTINVTGGSIADGLYASDSSTVNLRGGSVAAGLLAEKRGVFNISGGQLGKKIIADDNSALNFLGVGLSKTLTDAATSLGGKSYSLYTLSGKLRDGTSVNGKLVLVQNKSGAKITLTNAPAAPHSAPPRPAH